MMLNKLIAKRGSVILPFFVFWLMALNGYAQMNLSGKPGLMYIPTARETADGTFTVGYAYNPERYGLRSIRYRQQNGTLYSERVLYATLTLLPRLDINVNLLHLNGSNIPLTERGIGDRQLDIRYLLLKEKEIRPSVAVIMSSPFTVDASMVTYALVATKHLKLTDDLQAEISAGMGSPYYIFRDENINNNVDVFSKFKLRKKSEDIYNNGYLTGPFGGISVNYRKRVGLMAEWDSQRVNVGGYATLWKRWTIQAGLLNFDQVTFGTSYTVQLNALPRPLRKLHETE
ncbi:YjbH domain-containing protein [Telluribacter humicola]|uniref:YjbH domain-containing protein n=1 Tax=Telluribacter humicola TaxID=1720261 RepID=UPI001A956B21|nr:YjbH domain-containing protein [Telluribacter humicola]